MRVEILACGLVVVPERGESPFYGSNAFRASVRSASGEVRDVEGDDARVGREGIRVVPGAPGFEVHPVGLIGSPCIRRPGGINESGGIPGEASDLDGDGESCVRCWEFRGHGI